MKVASLFSGCGGLDQGLHQAGHEVILLCDSDPGARQVLRQQFPGVRVHEDVTSLERLPRETELLTAGFPCIDRARDDCHPVPWVLLENVEALLDRHGGEPPVAQYVVRRLIDLGYGSWAYRVVNSAGFGLPNRRRRVFIVASLHGDARDGLAKCTGSCRKLFAGRRCFECHTAYIRQPAHSHEEVSYALDMGNAMSQAGEDVVPTFTTSNDRMLLLLANGKSGYLRIEDAERLQGLPEGYTKPAWPLQTPGVGAHRALSRRDADAEVAASKRWDLLGNAVTVPVARWIGERLASPYSHKYPTISMRDRRMDRLLNERTGDEGRSQALSPHLWSYEAVLFPYLVKKRKKEGEDESDSESDSDELDGNGSGDATIAASREAAAAVEQAQPLRGPALAATPVSVPAPGAAGEARLAAPLTPEEVLTAAAVAAEESIEEVAAGQAPALPSTAVSPSRSGGSGEGSGASGEGSGASAGTAVAGAPEECKQAQEKHSEAREEGSGPSFGRSSGDGESGEAPGQDGEGGGGAEDATAATGSGADLRPTDEDQDRREMFQAALAHRAERGKLRGNPRQQSGWDREAWPRAAWWVRGMGSFAVEDVGESPVGKPASQAEIEGYLNRLKERGWDCEMTLRRLLRNNLRVAQEVHAVVRIPGLLSDADMIGDLVWAKDPLAGVWWPAEKLNPFGMPAGRDLPAGSEDALTSEQKLASLPHYAARTGRSAPPSEASRRVLVCFLPVGGSQWQWMDPRQLEPFENNTERESEAQQLLRTKGQSWRWAEPLAKALQDAKASLAVLRGRSCMDADRMRRTRAQAMAAGVNLKDRCGSCRTCMNSFVGQRRYECLTQRMKAAALAGHAGAQVAINGEGALGARVAVWWDGDQTFFEGYIAHYDAVSTEHTILYDDGEVGMHRLWQHDERIRLLTPVAQWPRDAAVVRQKMRAAQDRLRNASKDRRAVAAAAAAAAVKPELTDYERQREQIIARNQAVFAATVGDAARALRERGELPPAPPGVDSGRGRGGDGAGGGGGGRSATPGAALDAPPRTPAGGSGGTSGDAAGGPPGRWRRGSPSASPAVPEDQGPVERETAGQASPPAPGPATPAEGRSGAPGRLPPRSELPRPSHGKFCHLCTAAGLPTREAGAAHMDCVGLTASVRTAKWACPYCEAQRPAGGRRSKGGEAGGSGVGTVPKRPLAPGGAAVGPPMKRVRCGECSSCKNPKWKKGCQSWRA
eukprot:scaffold18.g1977.t1